MKIGLISFNDPSRTETFNETLLAEIQRAITSIFMAPSEYAVASIRNERKQIAAAIIRLCDEEKCPLVLTLGGAGPALADIVPDVTMEVVDRKLPGFGEIMRYYSYERFKVSVLSRAEAGVRGQSLVINMPGKPKPVKFCMRLLQEGIMEALDQISGLKIELRGDEIVVPIDKYLPFLKKIRPKEEPGGPKHPYIQ